MTDFETHITIAASTPDAIGPLQVWAADHRLKFTHIQLDRGRTPSQPMVTRHARGTLAGELAMAADLAGDLRAAGHPVVRIKLEVAADDDAAPANDAAAARNRPDQYFEAHVKLLLPDDASVAAIAVVAVRHSAHVSRNARRVRDDGQHERFLTRRAYGVGRETADRAVDALLADLATDGVIVMDAEREFVVHDSNLTLDAGWM
jgi:hypothetical protein